jgi:ABC-type transport system involved in cytochrome bd biosynthesis fused ATPase/permease subunit
MSDPVRAKRAQAARLAELGQRVGYGLLLVAVIAFVVGAVRGFSGVTTAIVTVALLAMTVVLAPAIVLGYAVKAAEREDREQGR